MVYHICGKHKAIIDFSADIFVITIINQSIYQKRKTRRRKNSIEMKEKDKIIQVTTSSNSFAATCVKILAETIELFFFSFSFFDLSLCKSLMSNIIIPFTLVTRGGGLFGST